MARVRLGVSPIGSAHPVARCCWCQAPLVIAAFKELQNIAANLPKEAQDRCWVCPNCWRRQIAVALMVRKGEERIIYHIPLPSQVLFYESRKRYRMWGGRAGPGKSTGVRWFLYRRSLSTPGHRALLLRENWDQLRDNHIQFMKHEVPLLGGVWRDTDRMAVFGKGTQEAIIACGHMADDGAIGRYTGIEYGAIVPEEAALYPLNSSGTTVLAELSTRARAEYTDVDGNYVEPVFLPVTNPGGPSAAWLYDMHIAHQPDFDRYPALRPDYDDAGQQVGGYREEDWEYLPASLSDNPYMREDYARTDLAVLSEVRYKQLAEGDWNSFEGMFFPQWDTARHVRRAEITA